MKQKLLSVTGLLTICLVSCKEAVPPQQPVDYSVQTVARTDVTLTESYSASVRGRQDIEIYPQVSGTIQRVCVKEGEKVRKGQSLFIIDRVPYEAALRTAVANVHAAEAQVETARITFESKQELFRQNVVSEFDLSTARNALAVAEASLEQARAEEANACNSLSYTEVKSPADGVVGTIPYRVGALVGPTSSQPLTTVADNSEMYVYFSMSKNRLQELVMRYGSLDRTIDNMPAVQLRLNDGTLYAEEGRVESISGVLNPETGSGSLRAVFPNPNRILFSGGTGNVVIPQHLENAIAIPQEATYELQDKIFVYRVIDGKAVATRIEVSPIHDGVNYTVTKGLSAGDVIVTTGVGLLNDGDEIKVNNKAGGNV
ncbi:efflux RND transporter periplasmic adaptor subunit [Alistipes sp. cv1]|uniref:efflux RND transporter periplasmic adaptor subunit n=1 Tax=Alistipes sp. cv1 TaxID=1622071 RepID=UPI0015E0B4D7|nr:efflux RND transporter periplasmic adaptor subunit [Alistipes sp. cv1]